MSVVKGVLTNEGLRESIKAFQNEGWKIYPKSFAVSDQLGVIDITRDKVSMLPVWYSSPISGRIVKDVNSIEFLCTIPPAVVADPTPIKELYLLAENEKGEDFLLALGGIDGDAVYDPAGSFKLRITVTIQNVNLTDLYVFKYTQATEIFDHNNDPNAHPELAATIANSGKPVSVSSDYESKVSETLFVNTRYNPVTVTLPSTGLINGSRLNVVDLGGYTETTGKEIYVKPKIAGHKINGYNLPFCINVANSTTAFIFDATTNNWIIDLGGKLFGLPDSYSPTGSIKYTDYMNPSTMFSVGGNVTDIGGSGSVIPPDGVVTTPGDIVNVDTSKNDTTIVIKLPAKPKSNEKVQVVDITNNFDVKNASADGNGNLILGKRTFDMTEKGGVYNFIWNATLNEWGISAVSTNGKPGGSLPDNVQPYEPSNISGGSIEVKNGDAVFVNTTTNTASLLLPSNASNGSTIRIYDSNNNFKIRPCTVVATGTGGKVAGKTEPFVCNVENGMYTFVYDLSNTNWKVTLAKGDATGVSTGGSGGGTEDTGIVTPGDATTEGAALVWSNKAPNSSGGKGAYVPEGSTVIDPDTGAKFVVRSNSESGSPQMLFFAHFNS